MPLDFTETINIPTGKDTPNNGDGLKKTSEKPIFCGKRKIPENDTLSPTTTADSDFDNLFCSDRTGRWFPEEVAYLSALTDAFDSGMVLIMDGTKLHDFLANMLKCKLSRLTKKFKKANFTRGYTIRREKDFDDIRFKSIRKKLADTFSSFVSAQAHDCTRSQLRLLSSAQWKKYLVEFYTEQLGKSIDNLAGLDDYRRSVEELDRLIQRHEEEFKKRRKLDVTSRRSISIEDVPSLAAPRLEAAKTAARFESAHPQNKQASEFTAEPIDDDFLLLWGIREEEDVDAVVTDDEFNSYSSDTDSSSQQVHPFLSKLEEYLSKNTSPFDYAEVWLPILDQGNARLVCGGCVVTASCHSSAPLLKFAEVSSRTVFEAGVGIPGRTFSTGRSCWEQAVQYAQSSHFLRVESAGRYGIQTAVGIPIECEAVGTLVVCFFSRANLNKDDALIARLWKDLSSLNSVSQWALDSKGGENLDLLDTSFDYAEKVNTESNKLPSAFPRDISETNVVMECNPERVSRELSKHNLLALLTEQIPLTNTSSTTEEVNILNGFMLLRMLLLRSESSLNAQDLEIVQVICASYQLYAKMNKWSRSELAQMTVREFLFLSPNGTGTSVFYRYGAHDSVYVKQETEFRGR